MARLTLGRDDYTPFIADESHQLDMLGKSIARNGAL
jgi:hypothetical protein